MIDPDRPFRDQDPLDQNARSGAEGSGVGAWDLELSTRTLSWSTATRKLFGVGSDAPVDYDLFLSLLDAQDRDRTARAVQESIDTGCNFDVQYRVHRDSDEGHWVRAVGTTINGPDGAPARLSGVMIDINREKRLEDEVRTQREALSLDSGYDPGCDDRDRRARHHAVLLQRRRASVRIQRIRGDRKEHQRADAGAGSQPPRRLSRALPEDGRTAHHRHRAYRHRHAQGRHDVSDAPHHRRDAFGGKALLYRLRPRSHRAATDPGTAAGTAIRTGPRLAPERDGRDGFRPGPRTQSAAVGHQQLHEGIAPPAGRQHRRQRAEDRSGARSRRRTGDPRRRHHQAIARLRRPRRVREARRESFKNDRRGRRARAHRRPRTGRVSALQPGPDVRPGACRQGPDSAGPGQPVPQCAGSDGRLDAP